MKQFLIFVVGLLSAVNACTLKNINSDPVKEIEFDKDGNIHVISVRSSRDVLTLLDKTHKVLREIEAGVTKNSYLITTKDKQVFFMVIKSAEASSPNTESCQGTLYNYNRESVTSRVFDNLKCDGGKSILDKDHNLYINNVEGVSLVRKNQTTPIPISNLEKYTFHHILEDPREYVFVASNEPGSIYVITEEQKSSLTPSAQKVNKDRTDRIVCKFVYRGERMPGVIFAKNDYIGTDLKFLLPDGLVTWMLGPDPNPYYGHLGWNSQYVYFVEINIRNFTKLCKSTRSEGLEQGPCTFDKKRELIASDSSKNVYVACNKGLIYIFSLRQQLDYKPEPQEISIPNNEVIEALAMDRNDHLWILAKNIFEVTHHGGFKVDQRSYLTFTGLAGVSPILKINPDTQDKFIGAQSGLHVCA